MEYQYGYMGFGWHIVMLIHTALFIIPVLALAYKQGGKDQRLAEVEKDLNGLGLKVSSQRDEQANTLAELNARIGDMRETLAMTTIQIKNLIEVVKEMKKQ